MARNETTFTDGHEGKGGRPKGSPNKATIEVREVARGLIEDPEYQASLRQRLIAGKAPHMESLLWMHLYGKPVERHEVTASARPAGPEGSEPTGSEGDSRRDFTVHGVVINQDARERLRMLMARLQNRMTKTPEGRARMASFREELKNLEALEKEKAKDMGTGESPSGTPPPTESA